MFWLLLIFLTGCWAAHPLGISLAGEAVCDVEGATVQPVICETCWDFSVTINWPDWINTCADTAIGVNSTLPYVAITPFSENGEHYTLVLLDWRDLPTSKKLIGKHNTTVTLQNYGVGCDYVTQISPLSYSDVTVTANITGSFVFFFTLLFSFAVGELLDKGMMRLLQVREE